VVDAKTLDGIPLFQDLSSGERKRIARWADEVDVAPNRHLLDQGDFPHEFFVLLEGEVAVRKGEDELARLGPGDFFGEIAILKDDTRTASVVTITPCRLAVMMPRDFDEMRAEMPQVAERIRAAAIARLQR
jgi:CRP-like cAMP-binding protein